MQFWQEIEIGVAACARGSELAMKRLHVAILSMLLVTAGSMRLSGGQILQQPFPQPGRQPPGLPSQTGRNPAEPDPLDPHREQKQADMRNADRQKRLEADTEKLLTLATDLKEQVGKTNKQILSVDVIKKADEIEKLARSVKERMKG
jgi:hypothetical protein